jgi:hypothetical protein
MRAGGRKPAIYDLINRLAVDPDTAKDALILWLMARLLEAEQAARRSPRSTRPAPAPRLSRPLPFGSRKTWGK